MVNDLLSKQQMRQENQWQISHLSPTRVREERGAQEFGFHFRQKMKHSTKLFDERAKASPSDWSMFVIFPSKITS
jgi:hypothetical protein